MRISRLNLTKNNSNLLKGLVNLSNTLQDGSDESKGYAFFRGRIYSYSDDLHIDLLGSDVNGNIRVLQYTYLPDKMSLLPNYSNISPFSNSADIVKCINNVFDILDNRPEVYSQIYWDFVKSYNWPRNCPVFSFNDMQEAGSDILVFGLNSNAVDDYMLSEANQFCRGTMLSVDWATVYESLTGADYLKYGNWFKKIGITL